MTLLEKVESLTEKTPPERQKKAVLHWLLEDAEAARAVGLDADCQATLQTVEEGLDAAPSYRIDPPERILPPVRDPASNPYPGWVYAKAERLAGSEETFKKGDEGYRQIENAWRFRTLGDEAYGMAWAFCYPHSPLAGSPDLLMRILRWLQAIFQNHREGDFNPDRQGIYGRDENINRFCFVPTLEAYLLMRSAYPDVIPEVKRAAWEASARVAADYQVETYGSRISPHGAGRYPNMDVHYMLMMELASQVLGEARYHEEAEKFLGFTGDCLYPDGGFTYHGHQNECYVYHQINVAHLWRYWQLAGNSTARELIERSVAYYPYAVEPGGVPEYHTDSFWKHTWSPVSAIGPEIVAGVTGDGQNKQVANVTLRHTQPDTYYAIYAASAFRDIPARPQPDAFIRYDRNIEGPRGRFGRFSWAGTTRDYGDGCQGKDTFVGCTLTSEEDVHYPLDAALQVATNQYRLHLDGQRWRACRYLSQAEQNAVTIGADFSALTTRYRIQNVAWGGKSTLTAWAGQQEWLLTPGRLVGLLAIETLSEQQAYSIHGRLRLGMHKAFEQVNDAEFQYGGLRVRLHEHTYADVVTERSETFYRDEPDRFRSNEIVLRDAEGLKTGGKTLVTYPKGTRMFFIAEVFPNRADPARSVKRISTADGLAGVEVEADGFWRQVVHNPTEDELTYPVCAPAGAASSLQMHRSGAHTPAPEAVGDAPVSIPPHGHVVIEGGMA